MYVCNCNGIREKEILAVVDSGVRRWESILAYFHCEPRCGKCEEDINLIIKAKSQKNIVKAR